ncbi:uncharacterized protein LOC114714744 [Neltuma alba]|uniref:uncharacterized protein LOC114714744 n=1 Tax=Neltuma alba TaxID=207710 RepID=UPI0010A3929A|nr:uncharacterized protein LOC114714744 [Prosopis alba]
MDVSTSNGGHEWSSDEDDELSIEEDDETYLEEDNMSLDNVDTLTLVDEDMGSLSSNLKTDSLKSIDESDLDLEEGVVTSSYKRYNPYEMCKDFIFKLGMEFTSIDQFREAVRDYSLMNGYETIYVKNDSVRCRIKCVRCNWLIFVSKERDSMTYHVKTYNSRHTCGVTFSSRNVSSKWVSRKIKNRMKINKNMSLGDAISTIKEDYMVEVSVPKAYWARRRAKQDIEGDFVDEYKRLWDYNNEIFSKSPGTSFTILTDRPFIDRPPRFKRLYLCLDAVKIGFLAACRPIIGLDGCFLKGPYGGILLVAVGHDANEQYFPLEIAVVEVDLASKSCACRWWNLTGIPCRHAVSSIYVKREDRYDYVHSYLKIDAYVECYSPVVKPINGQEMWEATNREEIDPLSYHRRLRRPPKLRRRVSDEPSQPNKI